MRLKLTLLSFALLVTRSGVAFAKTGTGLVINPAATADIRQEKIGDSTGSATGTSTSGNGWMTTVNAGFRQESGLFYGLKASIDLVSDDVTSVSGDGRTTTHEETFWRAFGPSIGYISDQSFCASFSFLPYLEREVKVVDGDNTLWKGGYGMAIDIGFRFDVSEIQVGPMLLWRSYQFKKAEVDPQSGDKSTESVNFKMDRILPYFGAWFYL